MVNRPPRLLVFQHGNVVGSAKNKAHRACGKLEIRPITFLSLKIMNKEESIKIRKRHFFYSVINSRFLFHWIYGNNLERQFQKAFDARRNKAYLSRFLLRTTPCQLQTPDAIERILLTVCCLFVDRLLHIISSEGRI